MMASLYGSGTFSQLAMVWNNTEKQEKKNWFIKNLKSQ